MNAPRFDRCCFLASKMWFGFGIWWSILSWLYVYWFNGVAWRVRLLFLCSNGFAALILTIQTDIADKDLKALRNSRWDVAFSSNNGVEEVSRDATNRKATIVIEHLIQACDVAHTMSHWRKCWLFSAGLFDHYRIVWLAHNDSCCLFFRCLSQVE